MYMKLIDDQAHFGISFKLESFPELIEKYRNENDNTKNTPYIEEKWHDFITKPIDDFPTVEEFIKDVCEWGGPTGNRVRGNLLKKENNTEQKILTTFEEVRQILIQDAPNLNEALSKMISIKGLRTSYASKHLRFMLPKECPVYDSILDQFFPYSFDPDGYVKFARDCKSIGGELRTRGISNPVRESGEWFAADVESAIFYGVRPNNG